MGYNFTKEAKLFMVFDILGDTVRSGPLQWHIERERLEDVKNHILDLLLMARILKNHLPKKLNYEKITDYIICHDLPEAITGDITKFEGVSEEEIKRVTDLAINYLSSRFNDVIDIKTIIEGYDNKIDLEAKIVSMLDKVHSATTFIKYQSEQNVDMDNPEIIGILRNHPFVVQRIKEGKDIADIFFEYHMKSVTFNYEEMKRYNLKTSDANEISNVIKAFATRIYNQKQYGAWSLIQQDFPIEAMKYNKKPQ